MSLKIEIKMAYIKLGNNAEKLLEYLKIVINEKLFSEVNPQAAVMHLSLL